MKVSEKNLRQKIGVKNFSAKVGGKNRSNWQKNSSLEDCCEKFNKKNNDETTKKLVENFKKLLDFTFKCG